MTDDDLLPWRSREAELEKEYTPHWKIGMLRRENMIQLFNELIDRDLDYEVFSSLYNDELKKYAEAVNGTLLQIAFAIWVYCFRVATTGCTTF